jgi:hypothetical protein
LFGTHLVSDDGCKALPVRDKSDNVYHILGKLEVGSHSVIKSLVTQCVPLLRAGGEFEKDILSPLPRYVKVAVKTKTTLRIGGIRISKPTCRKD